MQFNRLFSLRIGNNIFFLSCRQSSASRQPRDPLFVQACQTRHRQGQRWPACTVGHGPCLGPGLATHGAWWPPIQHAGRYWRVPKNPSCSAASPFLQHLPNVWTRQLSGKRWVRCYAMVIVIGQSIFHINIFSPLI